MPTMSAASTPSRSVIMKAWSIYEDPAILKMNFNFNFKDMPRAAEPSIRWVTKTRDLHHTGKLWGGMVLTGGRAAGTRHALGTRWKRAVVERLFSQPFQERIGPLQLREQLLVRLKVRRMHAPPAAAQLDGVLQMQHLVIDD